MSILTSQDVYDISKLLKETVNEHLYQIILSNSIDVKKGQKVKIKPVLIKKEFMFQTITYIGTQVFHENLSNESVIEFIMIQLSEQYRQMEIETTEVRATVLISKKGKVTIKKKLLTENFDKKIDLSHNREKQYILQEGTPVPFLVDLGVQTIEGKTVQSKSDKFKQINRYLEFIRDVLPQLPKDKEISIIDFGCGKSYLTFALYYFLHEKQNLQVRIIGLDLKQDVIEHCNQLRTKYGYSGLQFLYGDISTYTGADQVDMVVTLHACDTATDYALYKAVKWGAKVILSVPCCQHELNRQIDNEMMKPILKYGLVKERMSALITDAIRADLLENCGYETQILEFIDMEHTPKNILIRAIKKEQQDFTLDSKLEVFLDEFHLEPTLLKLMKDEMQ